MAKSLGVYKGYRGFYEFNMDHDYFEVVGYLNGYEFKENFKLYSEVESDIIYSFRKYIDCHRSSQRGCYSDLSRQTPFKNLKTLPKE